MDARIRCAIFVGDAGRSSTCHDSDFVFLFAQSLHGQCHSRVEVFHGHVDFVAIKPLLGHAFGDIWLVLVIRIDDLDVFTKHLAAKVVDRHFGGSDSTRAAVVSVNARHVGQNADLDDVITQLALLRADQRCGAGQGCGHRDCN